MNALEEATAALRTAEQHLRIILAKTADAGDYDPLPQIVEWAKLLNAAVSGQPTVEVSLIPPQVVKPAPSGNGVHERAIGLRGRTPTPGPRKAKGGRRKKLRRGKATKSDYPKFVREGDSLVKIGWSKSEGKTYEHKAPRGVLSALVQALFRVGSGGERFTVETLLPLKDETTGANIPDYQTYLTLAWLRTSDLITQHGRQGYSLPAESSLERESERRWSQLSTR